MQRRAGQDPVTTRVLYVHVEVFAAHVNNDIQVDLQIVPYSSLHAEGMCCLSLPPSSQLGRSQPYARKHQYDRPDAAGVGLLGVGGFRFGKCVESFYRFQSAALAKVVLADTRVAEAIVAVHDCVQMPN